MNNMILRQSFTALILLFLINETGIAQTVTIRNVNVVQVEQGTISPNQNVYIVDGKIDRVDSKKIIVNEQYPIIDGTDKYLIPGLIDGHIHFFQTGRLYTRPDALDMRQHVSYEEERTFAWELIEDSFKRYLRLGITTVVDVGGPIAYIKVRDSIAANTLSPNVLITGSLFSPYQPDAFSNDDDSPIAKINTIAEADALFEKMIPHKPDFLKIWYIHSKDKPADQYFPVAQHIAKLAHDNDIKLAVHATQLNTAKLAIKAGADILVHSVEDTQVDEAFAKALTDNNVSYIPTLIVGHNYGKSFISKPDNHPQDLAFANPKVYSSLTDLLHYEDDQIPSQVPFYRQNQERLKQIFASEDRIMFHNLRYLRDRNVNIVVGTDAGNIGTMHASSLLQELETMQEAGMTIPEIIKAATINAARAYGIDDHLGSITKGKQADLVLLNNNPLESLTNLNAIDHVFKDGQALEVSTILQETPEEIVQRQLNAYNARDIDAFMNTYSDDIKLYNFPDQLSTEGKDAMREGYASFFSNTPDLHCEIKNRIVIGNKVIDEEYLTVNGNHVSAVAVYEVENGKIVKVTFVQN